MIELNIWLGSPLKHIKKTWLSFFIPCRVRPYRVIKPHSQQISNQARPITMVSILDFAEVDQGNARWWFAR